MQDRILRIRVLALLGFRCCFAPPSAGDIQHHFCHILFDVPLLLVGKLVSLHRNFANFSHSQSISVIVRELQAGQAGQKRMKIGKWSQIPIFLPIFQFFGYFSGGRSRETKTYTFPYFFLLFRARNPKPIL